MKADLTEEQRVNDRGTTYRYFMYVIFDPSFNNN